MLITQPIIQFQTLTGVPYAGAKARFYETGTTTPTAIYSDAACQNAIPQPVEADDQGFFPAMYAPTSLIRMKVWSALDVLLQDIDPVNDLSGLGTLGNSVYLSTGLASGLTLLQTDALAVTRGATLVIDVNYTLPASISLSSKRIKFDGGKITLGNYNLTLIVGFIDAPQIQCFVATGTGKLLFSALNATAKVLKSKWAGAQHDGTTDDTDALKAVISWCRPIDTFEIAFGQAIHSETLFPTCAWHGFSALTSELHNIGTGDAINFSKVTYYCSFRKWSSTGNGADGDGLSFVDPVDPTVAATAYLFFEEVYSLGHGGCGEHHREGWGCNFSKCRFDYNLGDGIWIETNVGDAGTANGVNMIQCWSRWNGGLAGRVEGAQHFSFVFGIYESNTGGGWLIGKAGGPAVRMVNISDNECEQNGYGTDLSCTFKFLGGWNTILFKHNWVGASAATGQTHYIFDGTISTDGGFFDDVPNTIVTGGAGTVVRHKGTQFEEPGVSIGGYPTLSYLRQSLIHVDDSTEIPVPCLVKEYDTDLLMQPDGTIIIQDPGYYRVKASMNYFPKSGVNTFIKLSYYSQVSMTFVEIQRFLAPPNLTSNVQLTVDEEPFLATGDILQPPTVYQDSGTMGGIDYTPTDTECRFQVRRVRHT